MANYYTWSSPDPVPQDTKIRGPQWKELKTVMRLLRGYIADFWTASGGTSVTLGDSGPYTSSPFHDVTGQAVGDYTGFDTNLGADDTKVRNVHVNSLRTALNAINTEWSTYYPAWSWCQQYSSDTGSAVPGNIKAEANVTRIRAVHVNELREQLDLIDASMKDLSPFCGTACQIGCQSACQTSCQHSCQSCNNSTCHDQMCGFW